ncbi:DUF6221 family protein [Streptomyces ipomoeae]|uniref:DUF6221 family protein n=1 Tax=Streptomyces ipomoeae TaxID=103232 RepID=UPI0029B5FE88|nr:DUF6221 family protein [Streptomyces ipomoeae]MDX2838017.1 DUF6221 family protein [Streptomyces ipomoeae]
MSEIADFLRTRIAERRAIAEAASPGPWHANAEHDEVLAADGITVAEGFALSGKQLRATVDHIATHDPETVTADLDAQLALVGELDAADPNSGYITATFTARDALKVLARPFAGHPDHKGEEWAP